MLHVPCPEPATPPALGQALGQAESRKPDANARRLEGSNESVIIRDIRVSSGEPRIEYRIAKIIKNVKLRLICYETFLSQLRSTLGGA